MIIRKLEVQGFKSFAERTKVLFHPGITAVVGPNGTGKSNLVDAMLWVLGGLRLKSVRGERTEDVIFNGNSQRPPLGMADVILTLGEDEEMTVSHRVFRTSESEYRMNGRSVRLKDIQDELWKHHIGEKEYFVIEQGSIGSFVTSKPNEKRLFLEEAAGTAFYKDKKRQAQSKLDATAQNLVRLEDIILEVEKAKGSLQRQAQAANRYRRLRERVRELTSVHFERRWLQLERAQREVAALQADCLAREQELAAGVKAEEKALAAGRSELWGLETGLQEGKERLFGLKSQIARLESEAEREARRTEFLQENRTRAGADRDERLEEILRLTAALEEARAARQELGRGSEARQAELRTVAARAAGGREGRAERERALDDIRRELLALVQATTEKRNERLKAEKELELSERQKDKLSMRGADERTAAREAEARLAAIEASVARLEGSRRERESLLVELRHAAAEAAAEGDSLRERLDGLRAKRDEAAHHLQALRRIEAQKRGDAAADIPGSFGLLADLIRTSPEDAPLVDVFWKEEARARVVGAPAFLEHFRIGLQGDFLITGRQAPEMPSGLAGRPDVLGFLKGRVTVDDSLRSEPVPLRDAVIARDVPAAVRLWLDYPELSFLTPGGDLLLPSGLLRLGARGDGMIALAREIRELSERIGMLDADIAPLTAALEESGRTRAALRERLESAAAGAAGDDRALLEARKEAEFARAERDRAKAATDVLGRELAILESGLEALARTVETSGAAIAEAENEAAALRARVDATERELAESRERDGGDERRAFELKAGLDLLREKAGHLDEEIRGLERRKDAAAAKIARLEEDIRAGEETAAGLSGRIDALRADGARLEGERTALEESLARTDAELRRVRESVGLAEQALQRTREGEEAAKDARVRQDIRRAEVERDLVNLEETCWQELKKTVAELKAGLEARAAETAGAPAAAEPAEGVEAPDEDEEDATPAAAGAEAGEQAPAAESGAPAAPKARRKPRWRPAAELSDPEVEHELDEARELLNRFRSVNLMAEEEYAEQKKRCDFLVAQRQDLRDSISSTQEAIRKIDEESQTQFLRAVGEVNRNFGEIFTLLFKGGNAEVKLLDPDNPLDSGVEIVAQPPGKRVQNLALLSGGEKSLTSLAFLFALFRYRPSPFCFLDEVDAALDDVNLARFLDLMKAIKSQTQFIIITHNYRTMEVADYIYGTTMEEPNITKLYSVKLEKKEDAALPT